MGSRGLDVELRAGNPDLPACVLIHGTGMNKHMWVEPDNARVMGGLFPMRVMLHGYDVRQTLFHDLEAAGYTVITWSQRRPVGPAAQAVAELRQVAEMLLDVPHRGLVIIGHSRGGLIARAALGEGDFPPPGEELRGLFTLCAPHAGSELSRWAVYVSALTSRLNMGLDFMNSRLSPASTPKSGDAENRRSIKAAIKGMLDFLESRGVRELLPDSEFITSLPPERPGNAYCFSIGGTNPALLSIPGLFDFPSIFQKIIPVKLYPAEMSVGKGDGLVTARSARMPFADEHRNYDLNHAAVAVDSRVRHAVMRRIKRFCLS